MERNVLMNRVAATSTATSALHDQDITAHLTVEIMTDLDTGETMLLTSTQPNQGDLQVVTVDQARAKVAEQRTRLNRQERLILAYETSVTAPTGEPHSWTITGDGTGKPLTVTCMSGCNSLHMEDEAGTATAADVSCVQYDTANTTELAIGCGSQRPDDWATLSVEIHSDPVHPDQARRMPHASIEVTEDHYIEDLDPDGLAVVIDKLDQRVAAMRVRHAELVRIRDEYVARSETQA